MPALIEPFESRQLLSGTAFGFSGAAGIDEGAAYTLTLSASGPGAGSVDHWTIDWGDGNVQTVSGSPPSIDHAYADGAADRTISATVTTNDNTTCVARNGPAVNDGDLDTSFGGGAGKLKLSGFGQLNVVVALPGGKFLAAGTRYNGVSSPQIDDYLIARFNADGTLDTTFGANGTGTVEVDFANRDDQATALLVQPNGKILVGGRSMNSAGTSADFGLTRLNADGTLDDGGPSDSSPGDLFGTAGTVRQRVGAYNLDYVGSLALQSDGKIVAGGYAQLYGTLNYRFALARFNVNGTLDTGFAGGGSVETDFPDPYNVDRGLAVAVQADDKIVLAGTSAPTNGGNFAAIRYNANGTLDTSFASSGFYTSNPLTSGVAYAVALQADGKILLGGKSQSVFGNPGDWAVIRLTSSGAYDTTFGNAGSGLVSTVTAITSQNVGVRALSVLSDGRILAAGTAANASGGVDYGLVRYNASGSVDTTFGTAGKVLTDIDNAPNLLGDACHDAAGGLAVAPGGRIILVGGDGGQISYLAAYYGAAPAKVVHVNDVAPSLALDGDASVIEGAAYTLLLSRTDPGADTPGAWVINWGDGSAAQTVAGTTTSVNHTYADNGACTISATTSDEDGTYTAPSKAVQVNNVAPTLTVGGAASSNEGADYSLTLSAADPGADTISGWTIEWGDASATQTVTPAQAQSPVIHRYADGDTAFTITVRATDEDGTYAAAAKTVAVANVGPTLAVGGAASANEGSDYALSLSSTDPGTDVVSSWTVNWGDGSAGQTVTAAQAQSPVNHRYGDNGSYTILVTATDDDGTYPAAPKSVSVANVAPALTLAGAASCNEAASYSLTLSATDPGADTISQWVINWGDGSAAQTVSGGAQPAPHVYADGAASYTLSVTAIDEDGNYSASRGIQVVNVAPTVTLGGPASLVVGNTYVLTLSATDPGPDTIAGWTIDWGDGSQSSPSGTPASVSHIYAATGNFTVAVSVTDEDGTFSGGTRAVAVLEPDRAQNRPTTASSYDPTNLADYRALRSTDGNSTTRWSAGQGGTQWVRVDLGTTYNLSRVKLNWEGAYASAYKIQVSDDQVTWRDAASVTSGDGGADELAAGANGTGLSGNGRYVQVLCTGGPYGNYSLWDFEVYGNTDLALNRPASASQYDPTSLADYRALRAADGNSSSRWSAGGGGSQWLRVDLGGAYRLSRVKLNWEGAYASSYKIQTSADGTTWRDAYVASGGDGAVDDITTGVNGAGRYVQVLCTGGPYGNYSLWDFEVYGAPDLAYKATATASSYDPTTLADYRPGQAVDGNMNTRWSAGAGGTQWLRLDLGATFRLSRVKLNWEGAYASSYKIQVSDDQATWREAANITGGDGGLDDLGLTPGTNTTGRYVQVLCVGGPYGNYSLWNAEAYAG